MKLIMRITKKLEDLQKKIGLEFKNVELLENAFVHRSYHNENREFPLPSNEKLEFLGDSVLSLVTSVHLYTTYPEYKEGDYTDIKAAIVNTNSLYEAAKTLGIGDYLYLSKGEQENNGRDNISILADCFEALIGTIYLEHGFDVAYNFINTHLFSGVLDNIVRKKLYLPAKNILQEFYQEKYKKLPTYRILSESGPEHNKIYVVGVFDNDKILGEGSGKSKKQGEEEAARSALQKLGI